MDVMFVDRALCRPSTKAARRQQYSSALLSALTSKEMRILEFLGYGATNKEMGRRLFVTENTIKFHLKNIYGKLHVTNRLQAMIAARELGLIDPA